MRPFENVKNFFLCSEKSILSYKKTLVSPHKNTWAHVDGMTGEHKTHDLSHAVHVQYMTIRWHEMNETTHIHSSVRVDVLCVEDSHGGHGRH